jgi:restriction system protein
MPTDPINQVPKYHELMFPCLKALKALGGSGTNEEILDKVCELEKYPAEVQQAQHTDHRQTVLNYRLAWAKTYLKRVGALDNSDRGVWTITEQGAALAESDCHKIPTEVRKAAYIKRKEKIANQKAVWPAPGLDDTDLSESCLPLELHRA